MNHVVPTESRSKRLIGSEGMGGVVKANKNGEPQGVRRKKRWSGGEIATAWPWGLSLALVALRFTCVKLPREFDISLLN